MRPAMGEPRPIDAIERLERDIESLEGENEALRHENDDLSNEVDALEDELERYRGGEEREKEAADHVATAALAYLDALDTGHCVSLALDGLRRAVNRWRMEGKR
jgi:cell division protein FtsB